MIGCGHSQLTGFRCNRTLTDKNKNCVIVAEQLACRSGGTHLRSKSSSAVEARSLYFLADRTLPDRRRISVPALMRLELFALSAGRSRVF